MSKHRECYNHKSKLQNVLAHIDVCGFCFQCGIRSFLLRLLLLLLPHQEPTALIVINQLLPTACHQKIASHHLSSTNCHQPIVINQLLPTTCHQPIATHQLSHNQFPQLSPTKCHQPITNQLSSTKCRQPIMICLLIVFSKGVGCTPWRSLALVGLRRCSAVICVRGVQKHYVLQCFVGVEDPQFGQW